MRSVLSVFALLFSLSVPAQEIDAKTLIRKAMDNWRGVTKGSRGSMARAHGQRLTMGVGHEGRHPDYPGIVSERYVSENNQRHFYRRWEEFMNADSWTDIPLEPITANFDGSAALNG